MRSEMLGKIYQEVRKISEEGNLCLYKEQSVSEMCQALTSLSLLLISSELTSLYLGFLLCSTKLAKLAVALQDLKATSMGGWWVVVDYTDNKAKLSWS